MPLNLQLNGGGPVVSEYEGGCFIMGTFSIFKYLVGAHKLFKNINHLTGDY